MPWTAKSGNIYKLCLLDTNALSDIVKMQNETARGFLKLFGPMTHAPCLTVYNLIELRRRPGLFDAFLDFFSVYPILLLQPQPLILQKEIESDYINSDFIILNAFSPLGQNESYNLKFFVEQLFKLPDIASLEKKWRIDEKDILKAWLSMRQNFEVHSDMANAADAERYASEAGIQTLIQLAPQWIEIEMGAGRVPNIDDFPSLKAMLYSQYYRIFDYNRKHDPQDVTDVRIMACTPYIDVIVTESFQAEVFRKIKNAWGRLDHLQVTTLRDLRQSVNESA